MKTNILYALETILMNQISTVPSVIDHINSNRINSVGDLLEYYVKDAFCRESFKYNKTDEKLRYYQDTFSYLGNSNNPPDFIIKNGPAVEVKKIEGINANTIALNSSQPKDYLYSDDPKINAACRECESNWNKKDLIYAVGNIKKNQLHSLWFIYGDCYAADKSVYANIAETIKSGVLSIPEVVFEETKELGRVNRIDPLGITYLRIRGMWGIAHPSSLYGKFIEIDDIKTNVFILMKKETYESILEKPDFSHFIKEGILTIAEINIADPNNPAKNLRAILFTAKF